MNLDLREIPAVYINLEQDVERKNSIVDVLDECGFENIIRVDGEYTCLLYTSPSPRDDT